MRRITAVMLVVACLAAGYAAGSNQLLASRVAVAADECQTFPQTGKQVCGRFLEYWRANGGLAQQGFPLSNVFDERSDIDGKIYKVQYFERAVFELHPENRPPYDVLLSLVGRETFQAKYPLGEPGTASPPPAAVQRFSGNGTQVVQNLNLAAGLVLVRATFSKEDKDRNIRFEAELRNSDGKNVGTFIFDSPTNMGEGSSVETAPSAGTYLINVNTDTAWTIEITQPGPAERASAPELPQSFSGKGAQYTGLFKAQAGTLIITLEYFGATQKSNAYVNLFDGETGELIEYGPSGVMPFTATKAVRVPKTGIYVLGVGESFLATRAPQGNWKVTATR